MPLTDTAIKNAKPNTEKPNGYKITDEKGMYLFVHANGGKYFRLNYRFNKQGKTLALGVYPETTLKEAREKRDIAKNGIDPSLERKIKKTGALENSFQAIALEWYKQNMTGKSESHQKRTYKLISA